MGIDCTQQPLGLVMASLSDRDEGADQSRIFCGGTAGIVALSKLQSLLVGPSLCGQPCGEEAFLIPPQRIRGCDDLFTELLQGRFPTVLTE
jgi:hypothetical protein